MGTWGTSDWSCHRQIILNKTAALRMWLPLTIQGRMMTPLPTTQEVFKEAAERHNSNALGFLWKGCD
eukprot:5184026-Ditylum_brightwellii.AAC.1